MNEFKEKNRNINGGSSDEAKAKLTEANAVAPILRHNIRTKALQNKLLVVKVDLWTIVCVIKA